MLPFHEHILAELIQEDGLVVMGAGLGLHKAVASLLRLHSAGEGMVLVLSASDYQKQAIREELQAQDMAMELPVDVNNEYTGTDRLEFYNEGGVFFITSRILVVDMLTQRLPLHRVAGMLVLNAHRLSESCTEAFIARLYRAGNKKGFMRAFSDKPQALVSGFSKPERVMRSLFVRKLHLWPRFQLSIASALEENPPQVIDIRIPLTIFMEGIQTAILEVMDACLKELKKTNKVDAEDLNIETGLFKSFDEIIRSQLDPIWHIIGRKTKQLVEDLKTLRKLADYLVRYDAVTFLKYLDTLRVSEGLRSVWIFANSAHRIFEFAKRRVFQIVTTDTGNPKQLDKRGQVSLNGARGQGSSQGMSMSKLKKRKLQGDVKHSKTENHTGDETVKTIEEAAEEEARLDESGTHGKIPGVEVEVIVEEMPKWKVLREVLEEIEDERQKNASFTGSSSSDTRDNGAGLVLVACKDERTCLQLQDYITKGSQKLMNEEWEKYLLGRAELQGMLTRKKKRKQGPKGVGILHGVSSGASSNVKDGNNASSRQEQDALLAAAASVAAHDKEVIEIKEGSNRERGTKQRGRGRGKGGGNRTSGRGNKGLDKDRQKTKNKSLKDELIEVAQQCSLLQNSDKVALGMSDILCQDEPLLMPHDGSNIKKPLPPIHFYALDSQQRILDVVKPSFVVVYDPHMAFVREMEVYKAEHPADFLKVYFLFYEGSTELKKFDASIQRENRAFESLIRQKALMMIPVDQDGRIFDSPSSAQSPSGMALNAITRKAGGRKVLEKQMQIVVDMREFSSSLPCVLHQQGIQILPITLEVGDYILSPDICVERKSISDLYQSFSSGRLYHQAETMIRFYRIPVLLIEFSQDKSFCLQSARELEDDIVHTSIISKLSLLVLHFPRLRLVWSRSLHATADIFMTLKANQDEPDVEKAMRVGVPTEDGLIEGDIRTENYNTIAVEFLRRLPGVTNANYRSLMDGCKSLADLALLPIERLAELMGGNRPARMLRDFLDAKCPTFS